MGSRKRVNIAPPSSAGPGTDCPGEGCRRSCARDRHPNDRDPASRPFRDLRGSVSAASRARSGNAGCARSLRACCVCLVINYSFELLLCSEHTIDRSAHLLQNKSGRQATHHFELIRLTRTNFKSIGLHSFDGDLNHFFHFHGRSAFHVFNIKITQEFGLYRRRRQVKYLHLGVFQLHTKRLGERVQTGLGGAINR
jgi:hypothetical protein